MNRNRKKKLTTILIILMLMGIAIGLVLYSLRQNINLFFTPAELTAAHIHPQQIIRLGGYVKKGSVHYDHSGQAVQFVITDRKKELEISFNGVLPNLFREGQTVIVTGRLDSPNHLYAVNVLAKHDEKYMPKNLAKQLGTQT